MTLVNDTSLWKVSLSGLLSIIKIRLTLSCLPFSALVAKINFFSLKNIFPVAEAEKLLYFYLSGASVLEVGTPALHILCKQRTNHLEWEV